MNIFRSLLLFLLSTASSAEAQQLYKSMGSDGKVVFSDRPIDGKTKIATMKGTVIRPVEEAPQMVVAKPVTRALLAADDSLVTPDVEDTMLRIMELLEFGKRYVTVCAGSEHATRAFAAAHKGWMLRNALYIEQQKRLLMEVVSPTRRATIHQRLAASHRSVPNAKSSTAANLKLCTNFTAGLNSGTSDIVKPAMLAIPLTAYHRK